MRLLFLLLPLAAHAAVPAEKTCRVSITYALATGDAKESFFYTNAKDKKECQKEADRHRLNFAPETVNEKTVKAEWLAP